ncbi:replication initiator [Mycobacteroides abscessus]|uniref:replication initiator n=1 Tax=Mycobacteroides abscessus TaxID=36809 RepID=UPI000925A937|nr:replication initiator [Mycobacteroides abscessus]SHY27424.1 putative plasmid replication initiator protein [Mycobacteroides abscessus subsp. abscessus]SHY53464.1 putative plasmid replication initiator protein [Mycobacteroides abscessus subsp. abscessus]SIC42637.1 putative plasmid replication initiator protein [Mycobacteroides abscessus subsp. abscessus]SIC44910.1 putative plasmid replication initiator protein [Mycobacteroides abscessus subsp. abscessus]SIC67905.1 putative plasmid replicatio
MSAVHEAGCPAITLPGLPADIDHHRVVTEMMRRACSPGFDTWWRRAGSVGFCANPIQLTGTDEFGRERIVWVRCNNRRPTVCPSCSDLYARDTWQLVAAGTTGGRHNITPAVADRPQVFATLTAPSFGPVHGSTGSVCRDHRMMGGHKQCPHGKPMWCRIIHDRTDPAVGQPLCAECYDYLGHVLFTWHLPELWRRFTIALRRNLAKHLKAAGIAPGSVKASFVKVVEMQARAIPHIHALIRLDPPEGHAGTATAGSRDQSDHGPAATCGGGEPRSATGPVWEPPITAAELAALIQHAARTVTLDVLHPDTNRQSDNPNKSHDTAPLVVRFGRQIDTQPLGTQNHAVPTESDTHIAMSRTSPRRVAGYLAKYVTKSLQDFGVAARRLSAEAIEDLNVTDHIRAILTTIAHLADQAHTLGIDALAGIGRWLHTLGYRGHVTTKSRRYSVTMGALRAIRATWIREQVAKNCSPQHYSPLDLAEQSDQVGWEFDRAGHATSGDRTLVYSAALQRIDTRRIGLVEARRQARDEQSDLPGGPDD